MGSPKVDMDACSKAVYTYGEILRRARLNKGAPLPMKIRKEMGDGPETFVKMDLAETWLCKAVTGKTPPKHTSIRWASLLRDLFEKYLIPALDGCPHQDEDNDQEEPDDPMHEIEAPVVTGQSMGMASTVHRRMRRCRNPARGRILKC